MQEIAISKESIFMRIFSWSWKMSSDRINGCALFWGTISLPFAVIGHLSERGAVYLGGSLIFLLFDLKIHAAVFLLIGLAAIIINLLLAAIGRPEKKQEERLLSESEDEPSKSVYVVFYILGFIFLFLETKPGRAVEKSIRNLYSSGKEYCPLIRLV